MKIFHLGLCVGDHPKDSMRKAFLQHCTDYRELSTGEPNVNYKALEIVAKFRPDIIFMQIQAPNIIGMSTVKQFKQLGAWVVNWNGDIRHHTPDWMQQMAQVVDRTLFTNMRDARNVRNGGYLEIGYDPEIYCPEGDKLPCKPIVFFGNNYGQDMFPLSGLRLEMNHRLRKEFPHLYGVYGDSWANPTGNFNHSQYEEAKAYRSAKIAINLSHFDEERYSSDRVLRILGTGVFCLSKAYRDSPYIDGEHLRVWHDLDELILLIKRYMSFHEEREQIARQGHEFVKNTFTFSHMVQHLIRMYNER